MILLLPLTLTGCGLFSGSQVRQLQAENDKLVSEYRALRDRAARQEEKIAALEARNSEAEKMLARSGQSLPARAPQIASRPATTPSSPYSGGSAGAGQAPPYTPPTVPALNDTGIDTTPRWRPTKRQ